MGNSYNFSPIQSMFMKPGIRFTVAAILVLFLCGIALADDCGCGGFGDDGPGPSGGWDTHDDWDSSAGSRQDDSPADSGSGDSTADDSSDTSSGTDTGSIDDSGSSSSSGSEGSSSTGGGSVEEAVIWRMKGDDLYEKVLYNESLDAYDRAIRLDPYALKSWTGKGRALLALGRPADAVGVYERAIKLDPGNTAAYVGLGDALAAAGRYEEAVENFLKALAMNPKLSGVREKITAAEAAMAAALQTPEVTPEVTSHPESVTPTETVTLPAETLPGTTVVTGTPQAGISGFLAILAAGFACFMISRLVR